jgi:hypothetical protein
MSEQASGSAIAKRAVSIISLASVLFFPWSPAPARAQSEPPSGVSCKPEWSTIKGWLPPGARIQLLIAAGNTIPASPVKLWPSYREAALSIFACAGEGSSIELLPITDNGASVAPLFVTTAPTPTPGLTNPLRERLEREQFVSRSVAAIESLNTTTTKFSGFDPLGALQLAGESLHHGASGGKLVIVMIGNGWQQTDRINLFRWRDNPANHAGDVIGRLKADRTLPNLAGIDIVIAGLTRGDPRLKMGPAEFMGLRTFWERVIAASHGHLLWDQAYLPGMTASL